MNPPRLNRRQWLRLGFYSAPVGVAAHAFGWEPEWLKVRRVQLAAEPEFRLLHFTDLHYKGDRDYTQKVIREINALAPDAVCFTGDIIEEEDFLAEALELLGTIQAPLYGVPGNHDYWAHADFELIGKAFAATGGRWLMDQQVLVREGRLNLIGLTCEEPPRFNVISGARNVLLMHYPKTVEKLGNARLDLILAGHSHGGQVRVPFLGPLIVPMHVGKYVLGMFETKWGRLYVGAGIGYFFLNVRFNCRPEITLFEI